MNVTVAIVGLNRMSASLGLALRAPKTSVEFTVIGHDENDDEMKLARQMGAIAEYKSNLRDAIRHADVVIDSTGELEIMGRDLKAGAVVLGLTPLKASFIAQAQEHFPRNDEGQLQAYALGIQPIIQNPQVFDTRTSVAAATEDLFVSCDMVIAPDAKCPAEAVKLATDLTELLSMKPRFLSPEEYDALASFSEVFPLLLSYGVFGALQNISGSEEIERVINPTLADFLRPLVTASSPRFADLMVANPVSTKHHLDSMIQYLTKLRETIDAEERERLQQMSEVLLERFDNWEARRNSGEWESHPHTSDDGSRRQNVFGNLFGFGVVNERLEEFENRNNNTKRRRR